MLRHAEKMDFPGVEFYDEEDVEPLEEHGVHREKVRGQDAGRLRSEELSPRGSAPRSRTEVVTAKHTAHRRGRDPDPELAKLTLDADAAPAAVLPTEPDDEGRNIGI